MLRKLFLLSHKFMKNGYIIIIYHVSKCVICFINISYHYKFILINFYIYNWVKLWKYPKDLESSLSRFLELCQFQLIYGYRLSSLMSNTTWANPIHYISNYAPRRRERDINRVSRRKYPAPTSVPNLIQISKSSH